MVAVQQELLARHVTDVMVTSCGCLGPCFDGPNAVVYPDGVWYGDLAAADAHAIVEHLVNGVIYEAKRTAAPGS